MKYRSIALSLFFLLAFTLVGQSDAVQPNGQIKICVLNCEFFVRNKVHIKYDLPFTLKGDLKQQWERDGFRDEKLGVAAKALASAISKIDADLIGLIEVGDEDVVELLRQEIRALGVDYPHFAVGDSTDTVTGQHVAVLSKEPFERIHRTIPGREGYFGELDDPETEKDTAISKGMHVMFKVRDKRVNVFVVHLSSERGGHEQDAQRIAQASIVRRNYLKAIDADEHVVVMGDLNDHRGQPTLRRIRGLDDIQPDLVQTGGPVFNKMARGETPQEYSKRLGNHWTYAFSGSRKQIDHILVSRSIVNAVGKRGIQASFVDVAEQVGDTGLKATDHRAVVAEFQLQ